MNLKCYWRCFVSSQRLGYPWRRAEFELKSRQNFSGQGARRPKILSWEVSQQIPETRTTFAGYQKLMFCIAITKKTNLPIYYYI